MPPAEVTADQRRYIKAVNFGLIYGMSAFGLAQQLGIERGAAQQFIDKYFARYPGVAEYMQRTRELAREQGYVETVFGRRLWLPDIKAGGGPRRAGAERAAINAPMQGTAADLIKLAMIAVQGWLDARAARARGSSCRCTTSWCSKCPTRELARVAARAARADDGRRGASRAAGGRRRRRPELGAGALGSADTPGLPRSSRRRPPACPCSPRTSSRTRSGRRPAPRTAITATNSSTKPTIAPTRPCRSPPPMNAPAPMTQRDPAESASAAATTIAIAMRP